MKSEKWLRLYMEGIVRENIRMQNGLNELLLTETSDDRDKAIEAFAAGLEHNRNQIAFITWALNDDDITEITQDQKDGVVLDTIFRNMDEFTESFDSPIATKYYFKISNEGPDVLLQRIKTFAGSYCDEYGVDFAVGTSLLEIIRYKSELRESASVAPPVVSEEKVEEAAE